MYLIFVQSDKYGSSLIFLHTNCQVEQLHLLSMLPFYHCMFLFLSQKWRFHSCVGLFLGPQFYSTDFSMCFCTSIMKCLSLLFHSTDWGQGWWFFFQGGWSFCSPGFSVFSYEGENFSILVCEELCCNDERNCIEHVEFFHYVNSTSPGAWEIFTCSEVFFYFCIQWLDVLLTVIFHLLGNIYTKIFSSICR